MSTPTTPQWLVTCTKPSNAHLPYLEGPSTPADVLKHGYRFTADKSLAWPFPSLAQAEHKARVVNKHIGWTSIGESHMKAVPA